MKTLLLAALGLASSIHFATADVTSKLIGTWSGKTTAVINGTTIVQKGTIVYKRYQGTGLIAKTTITSNGQKIVGVTRYHKNGKVDGELKSGGSTVAFVTGKWRANNTTLFSTAKSEGAVSVQQVKSDTTLISRKQIKVIGNSNGQRSVGSFKKK